MTDIFSQLRNDAKSIMYNRVRLKYYTGSVSNTEWDEMTLTQSGSDVWTSGLCFPVKASEGSDEPILREQGKVKMSDKILFVPGDTDLNELPNGAIKIGIGSPVDAEHSIIPNGVFRYPAVGTATYKKVFCRELTNGSFAGE